MSQRRFTCLFQCLFVLWCAGPARSGGSPKRLALLVGINQYRGANVHRLSGCVNDVKALKSVLVDKYGFREQDIHTLTDRDASYAQVIQEFKTHLIGKAGPGDIVVFQFSGHGSRVEVGSDPSGFEESIVPYDSRDPDNLDITRGAISSLLKELGKKTKNITVILDSCHSGRMVDERPMRFVEVRGIPAAHTAAPPPPFPVEARSVSPGSAPFAPLDDSYVLIAAALANQYAKEYNGGFGRFGALTYFLVQELHQANPDATYRDIMDAVRVEVADRVEDQTPQLVGPNGDRYIFGNQNRIALPYVLVVSSGAVPGTVRLPFAGEIHGITAGSQYDVYDRKVTHFDRPTIPLGAIEISTVSPFESVARIVAGSRVPDFSRAILRQAKPAGHALRVWVQDSQESASLASIRKRLKSSQDVEMVAGRDTSDIQVIQQGTNIVLYSPDGARRSLPFCAQDEDVAEAVTKQVLKWTRWFYMLGLQNGSSDLKVGLSIAPRKPVFGPGEAIDVTIRNGSDRTVFVSLLVLSSDRSIHVLYPSPAAAGAAIELKARTARPIGFRPRAALPSCLKSTRDHFLLIATSKPIDLFPYQQSGFCEDERGHRNELQNLLKHGTPDLRTWGGSDPGQWTTFRTAVEVRERPD